MKGYSILCTAVLLTGSVCFARTPSFQGLAPLPGTTRSYANGVSADGTVVAGWSGDQSQAVFWTVASGSPTNLGPPPSGLHSTAFACSGDGSVLVGHTSTNYYPVEAFRWSEATGMVGLGGYPEDQLFTRGYDVSHDGSVIVGTDRGTSTQAFRWTEETGFVGLGFLPGTERSNGYGVSADGSVVVGNSNYSYADGQRAFRWTQDTGMTGLGELPGGGHGSTAHGVSANGAVVVGGSQSASSETNYQAFRWTEETGMVELGDLPTGVFSSVAYDASADGSVVVGYGITGIDGFSTQEAFIWDADHGMRNLRDVLINECGLDLSDWPVLECATGISDDGLVIVGDGDYRRAWVAVIPEPVTLSLLVIGSLAMLRRRRS